MNPYNEALQIIQRHPGTGGAGGLAKLVLSLYNSLCGYSFAECVGSLDGHLTSVALRMVEDYAKHGETEDLRSVGKVVADDLYPELWEMGVAIHHARQTLREKWKDDEQRAEADALDAAEAALFTDPAKLIPLAKAMSLLDHGDMLHAYRRSGLDWREATVRREVVRAAIEEAGGAELSSNCPDSSRLLAVRINGQVYYVYTDYEACEAYLEARKGKGS